MVQKIGAQFLMKRITDYVTAPPDAAEAPAAKSPANRAEEEAPGVDLDGQIIRDDDGQPLGIARRLRDVAVYVVTDSAANRLDALQACVDDPESRVLFHAVDDRLSGLIYVPDPAKAPPPVSGMRADEI